MPSRCHTLFSRLTGLALVFALLVPSVAPPAAVSATREAAVTAGAPAGARPAAKSVVRRQVRAPYRAGQLLVQFRDDIAEAERGALAASEAAARRPLRGGSRVELWTLAQGKGVEATAALLSARPAVEYAEPNYLITADQLTPSDPRFAEQWSLRNTGQLGGEVGSDIGVSRTWAKTTGSRRTVVAVVDGGVDFSHPDLAGNRWANPVDPANGRDDDGDGLIDDTSGWDWVAGSGEAKDPVGHGTAVAGLIAAEGNNGTGTAGVMWRAGLMSLRVLDDRGTGDVASAVEAIDYASSHGARVINCSWGTDAESRTLSESVERAGARGALVVASAGNDGRNVDASPRYPASYELSNVVSVAATNNVDQLTPWSNWGVGRALVAAPGADLLSTEPGGGYRSVSGTSAAAALVSGVAGLVKTLRPGLSARRTRDALVRGARQVVGLSGRVSAGGVVSAGGSSAALASMPADADEENTPDQDPDHAAPGGADAATAPGPPPPRPGRRPVTPLHPVGNLPNLDRLRRLKSFEPETPAPVPSTRPNHRRLSQHPHAGGGVTSTSGDAWADLIKWKYFSPLRSVQVAFSALMSGGGDAASPVTARDFFVGPAAAPSAAPAAATAASETAPVLTVTAASDTRIDLKWSAAAGTPLYRIERSLSKTGSYAFVANTSATTYPDTGVTRGAAGTAYLYRVCVAGGPNSCSSPYSNVALGTAYSFFEPTLVSYAENPAQATTVKARHVTELREAVNAVRRAAGLQNAAWAVADANLPGAIILASHVQELRDRLSEGLASLGIAHDAFEDQPLATGSGGTPIKKVHFEQLRRYSTALPDGSYTDINLDTSGIWAEARLNPAKRTGGSGVDLLSGNANWSLPLVSLPGRSGLDLGLSLTYNSRVWTKSDTQVTTTSDAWVGFDLDRGFPAPGFRLGFPVVEPYTPEAGEHAYLLIAANGDHVELRQVVEGGSLYESADSSYVQLTREPGGATLTLRPGDGSRMAFSHIGGQYHCTEIKDRNGNYLSASYDTAGQIRTITDTLGRVITFNYDQYQNLLSITQQWRDENLGQDYTRTWASFGWGEQTIETNFTNLTLIGIQNGTTVPVLNQVGLPDGTVYRFDYTRWGQVKRVSRHTLTSDEPPSQVFPQDYTERASTAYGLRDDGGAEADCPRVMSVSVAAQEWNGGGPAVTTYAYGGDDSSGRWGEATAPPVEPYTAGSRYKESYGAGWKRGQVIKAEEFAPSASTATKTTTTEWEQNNTSLGYEFNPRAKKIVVEDSDANKRQTVLEYNLQSVPQAGGSQAISAADKAGTVSLPTRVREETGAGVLLRSTRLTYETSGEYLDVNLRLVGLIKERAAHDEADILISKSTYHYDQADEPAAGGNPAINYLKELNSNPQLVGPTTRHDPAYGLGYPGKRGNLNIVRRWDVETLRDQGQVPDESVAYKTGYSTTGSVVLSVDPEGHRSTLEYADAFSHAARNGAKFAYPTLVADADGYTSKATYNYDFGAVTQSQSPMPNQTAVGVYGPTRSMTYDKLGRLTNVANSFNSAYTRWVYPASLTSAQTYTLLKEGSTAVESFSSQSFDGVGRVVAAARNMAEAGRYSGQKFVYDRLGRLVNQSNPTEFAVAGTDWAAAGDDAPANGGFDWVYSEQVYDWRGRVVLSTDAGGFTKEFKYGGCGCAGGATVLTRDEVGRRQKVFSDALGRAEKSVTLLEQPKSQPLNDVGDPYSTTVTTYNALDQVIRVRAHKDGVGGPYQEATSEYDGYGRLLKSKSPSQTAPVEYEYNADDTLRAVKDARGVRTQFLYNDRHLTTNVNYNVANVASVPTKIGATPGAGTPVEAAPNVTYTYDAAGNRKTMAEAGTGGGVSYTYDALSRLTEEARTFPGLPAADLYKLAYEYTVSGALKKVSDLKAATSFTTSYNDVGQLTGVSGVGHQGAQTAFVSQVSYRAWGALKSAAYGNGTALGVGYDVRGQMTSRVVSGFTAPAVIPPPPPYAQGATYEYHADGRAKFVGRVFTAPGGAPQQADRAYSYDHTGRLAEAYTGAEARDFINGTNSGVADGAYRHSYTYDAWGNMLTGGGRYWSRTNATAESYDTAGRNPAWEYDASGNLVSRHEPQPDGVASPYLPARHAFDAAGRQVSITQTRSWFDADSRHVTDVFTNTTTYDGDGRQVRYAHVRAQNGSTQFTGTPRTTYYLRSSVLGGAAVSEYGAAGQWQASFVYAGGERVGMQSKNTETNAAHSSWLYSDPETGDSQTAGGDGSGGGGTFLDPLGVDAGFADPFPADGAGDSDGLVESADGFLGDKGVGRLFPLEASGAKCMLDGIMQDCGFVLRLARNGGANPVSINISGRNGVGITWVDAWEDCSDDTPEDDTCARNVGFFTGSLDGVGTQITPIAPLRQLSAEETQMIKDAVADRLSIPTCAEFFTKLLHALEGNTGIKPYSYNISDVFNLAGEQLGYYGYSSHWEQVRHERVSSGMALEFVPGRRGMAFNLTLPRPLEGIHGSYSITAFHESVHNASTVGHYTHKAMAEAARDARIGQGIANLPPVPDKNSITGQTEKERATNLENAFSHYYSARAQEACQGVRVNFKVPGKN